MKQKRQVLDSAFKLEVVKMIKANRLSIPEVCQDMQVGETAIALIGTTITHPGLMLNDFQMIA